MCTAGKQSHTRTCSRSMGGTLGTPYTKPQVEGFDAGELAAAAIVSKCAKVVGETVVEGERAHRLQRVR